MEGKERLCLAQISNTLLKDYSYNEIHNRRVALGITCVQCTPVQVGKSMYRNYPISNKNVEIIKNFINFIFIIIGCFLNLARDIASCRSNANIFSAMRYDNKTRSRKIM